MLSSIIYDFLKGRGYPPGTPSTWADGLTRIKQADGKWKLKEGQRRKTKKKTAKKKAPIARIPFNLHKLDFRTQTERMKKLLHSVNARDRITSTMLHVASYSGNLKAIKMLLANGADINAKMDTGTRPLEAAIKAGKEKSVKLLLSKGAETDRTSENFGGSPLYLAIHYGYPDIAKLLIENGAKLNLKDTYGRSALHHAVVREQAETVNTLLRYGANENTQDTHGFTALYSAVRNGGSKKSIESLLKHGADPNLENRLGDTPLQSTVWDSDTGTAKMLLQYGARVRDEDLKLAKDIGNAEFLSFLRSHKQK